MIRASVSEKVMTMVRVCFRVRVMLRIRVQVWV